MAGTPGPLSDEELRTLNAWWRAANYLSVGQIYLLANPLLREQLRPDQVKPRLLGHWGTTPGLNFVYAHMNRAIVARELNAHERNKTAEGDVEISAAGSSVRTLMIHAREDLEIAGQVRVTLEP